MNSELLEYFHRELEFLDSEGPRFARQYPNIGPLLVSPAGTDADPHVERMIQAFAWLNARVQLHMDRDLAEVTNALFSVVFPYAQVPFPSCAVAEFAPRKPQELPAEGTLLPRGTELKSEQIRGIRCQFRTTSPVCLRPLTLSGAAFHRVKDELPVQSVLRLNLQSSVPGRGIAFGPNPLRIFLGAPPAAAFQLYEILVRDCIAAAVVGQEGRRFDVTRPGLVTGGGFQPDESLLPRRARVPDGHRMLYEYFAFPEKHLFVDVHGLETLDDAPLGETIQLDLKFKSTLPELEKIVLGDALRLNSTPIVNLFSMHTEPVALTHETDEYSVRPDVRYPAAYEIFSIDHVTAVSADRAIRVPEFYEPQRANDPGGCEAAWISRRRTADARNDDPRMGISLADPAGHFLTVDEWTLDVEATCMNADLPATLPFRGKGPRLAVDNRRRCDVDCIVPPTRRANPPQGDSGHGKFVAMLALQSLSLGENRTDVAPRLREFLRLWSPPESRKGMTNIDCLVTAEARQVLEEIWVGSARCAARGVEVAARMDESLSPGGSVFLFCSVLEQFLSVTSATNCFTRLVARSSETDRLIHRFPARAGDRTLATLT